LIRGDLESGVCAFDGNFAAVKDQISSVDRHDIDGGLAYIRSNSRRKKRYDRPVIFETLIKVALQK